jgi:hypothetical protein
MVFRITQATGPCVVAMKSRITRRPKRSSRYCVIVPDNPASREKRYTNFLLGTPSSSLDAVL